MSMPKVTYFDFAGSRGEEVRLALVIAGVAFDDNRVKTDDFARIKADLPFGSLPVFEVPGHGVFAETNAILAADRASAPPASRRPLGWGAARRRAGGV